MENDSNFDDMIKSVMKLKLKKYLAGQIAHAIARHHFGTNKRNVEENEGGGEAPTNVMGHSSSTSGTGNVDTFDPLLFVKLARRKKLAVQEGPAQWQQK